MRKAVIMSGISGAGKSTYIENNFASLRLPMLSEGHFGSTVVVSANHHFTKDGVYKFDAAELEAAHNACFRTFMEFCSDGASEVVVDNTNTTTTELAPYVMAAKAFGYKVEIITIKCSSLAAHARNTHNVPIGAVEGQFYRLQSRETPYFWKAKETYIDAQFPANSRFGAGGYVKV